MEIERGVEETRDMHCSVAAYQDDERVLVAGEDKESDKEDQDRDNIE